MCENCDSSVPQIRPSAALIARVREIEAGLPGDRVEDAAFDVFFGRRGGSIPWPQYQRLAQCMEAAMASMPARMLSCDDGGDGVPSPHLGAERVGVRWGRSAHTGPASLSPETRRLGRPQGVRAEGSPTSP